MASESFDLFLERCSSFLVFDVYMGSFESGWLLFTKEHNG